MAVEGCRSKNMYTIVGENILELEEMQFEICKNNHPVEEHSLKAAKNKF